MHHVYRRLALLSLVVCLALVACGDDGDPNDPAPPAAARIELSTDSLGLYAGETATLGAVAYDVDGLPIEGADIDWAVSDPTVAEIDSTGELTALGHGFTLVAASYDTISVTVHVRVTEFVEISAKQDPVCARDVEGAVWCIGTEWLGRVVWPHPMYETWTRISGDLVFSALTSGYQHTCGIANVVYCWGSNEHSELGNPDVQNASSQPVSLVDDPDLAVIDGGWEHTCGITPAGVGYCWGRNFEGQLGNGASGPGILDTVAGDHTWGAIDAGARTTCGVAADDGLAYCWGWVMNQSNEVTTPTPIAGVPEDLELIRTDAMACGAKDALVYCWGPGTPSPAQVTMPGDVVDLVLGDASACALLANGEIHCWGSNHRSLLGDPDLTSSTTPVRVDVGGRKFVGITGEWTLHCGLAEDGGVYCWGGGSIIDRPFPHTEVPTRVPAPMP